MQRRQPRGTSTGGEFAKNDHGDASAALGSGVDRGPSDTDESFEKRRAVFDVLDSSGLRHVDQIEYTIPDDGWEDDEEEPQVEERLIVYMYSGDDIVYDRRNRHHASMDAVTERIEKEILSTGNPADFPVDSVISRSMYAAASVRRNQP